MTKSVTFELVNYGLLNACRSKYTSTPYLSPMVCLCAREATVGSCRARSTQDRLLGDLWKRPGLSPRDRSVVTVAALITGNQLIELPSHLALDNGATPGELSEIITHLTFYAG